MLLPDGGAAVAAARVARGCGRGLASLPAGHATVSCGWWHCLMTARRSSRIARLFALAELWLCSCWRPLRRWVASWPWFAACLQQKLILADSKRRGWPQPSCVTFHVVSSPCCQSRALQRTLGTLANQGRALVQFSSSLMHSPHVVCGVNSIPQTLWTLNRLAIALQTILGDDLYVCWYRWVPQWSRCVAGRTIRRRSRRSGTSLARSSEFWGR